jgi:hypothetical protein
MKNLAIFSLFQRNFFKKVKKSLNFSFFKIWRDHGLTSENHKIMTFGDFVALEVSKDIFMIQTLHF